MFATTMAPVAIVTLLALVQYLFFTMMVGKARQQTGIKAPAMSGDPGFEINVRVHQNTLEQLILFLPALWLFAYYIIPLVAAGIGLFFIIGRFLYRRSYLADPATRGLGFGMGFLTVVVLLLGGLGGAVYSLI